MEISARILAIFSLAFFISLAARYFTHMFQLNSYTAKVQFVWYKDNFTKLLPLLAMPVYGVVCSLFSHREFSYANIAFGFCAIVLALFYTPKKAKKPIVYTARVKRLLTTFTMAKICIIKNFICILYDASW